MDIVETNRRRDLWLTNEKHVYYIPQNWCDIGGCDAGGLEYINEYGCPEPEIYCYAPTHNCKNSPVDTLFVSVSDLEKFREITEDEARNIHPELFAYLDKINNESIS